MTGRVVHVASGREWRGGQRQVWLLARELQRDGQLEQVVVTGVGSELAQRLRTDGVPVRETEWLHGLDPRVLPPIAAELRRGRVLLHAHDAHAVTLAGLAALVSRAPLVATRRVDFHLRRLGFWRRADRIIAISDAVADILIDDGIDFQRLVVVRSGIDLEAARNAGPLGLRSRLGLPEESLLAVTVGALVPHKDHATLLYAARRLRASHPQLHWAIAGNGELRSVLEWLRTELGLDDRVHFLGQLAEPVRLIAEADVFVMSSSEEGLGTSVLDAMARGIPVASTTAGGLPELLGEGAGLLVPPRNPEALAGAVARILDQPALASQLAACARRVSEGFSAERMAAEVRSVYRSCAPFL